MNKRIFEIQWDTEGGPLWMNRDNLLICLTNTCPNTEFTVRDVTGDGICDPAPATAKSAARRRLLSAIARGWCSKENENKTIDPDLANAIADEIIKLEHL